MHFVV